MRLYLILPFIVTVFAWAGTATPTPAPTIYRSPDGVFESAVPEGWAIPSPDQEKNTTPDRYRISYIENGIIKGYFQMFFQHYAYASVTSPDLPTDLKAALVAIYKDYSYASEISEAKVSTRDGYKITFSLDDSDSELRFVQVTPDLVAEVDYTVPKGSSEQFSAAHDLLFSNIVISPENIQTATTAPTATVPVLTADFTNLTNGQSVHAFNDVIELTVPAAWTAKVNDSIPRITIIIGGPDQNYGALQIDLTQIGVLDRSGQETDLKKAFQSYLDLMNGSGYANFGEISETQVAGQVAYRASLTASQGGGSAGDFRVMDIGNGHILAITFSTIPELYTQLTPVYESILSQLVIRPENIVTPIPIEPTPTA